MTAADIILQLKEKSGPTYLAGMQRFGIDNSRAFGVPLSQLRKIAKSVEKDHALALELWATGYHDARIMASLIDDPQLVTPEQMDA